MEIDELLLLSTMTLATCTPEGEPHAAPVYFACDEGLSLCFFSEPESQHSQDIASNPRAAVSIYPDCHGWQDIRGLQMRGVILPVSEDPAWEKAWRIYAEKFPFVGELKAVVASNRLYAFIPSWIRLVDNRQGFGFKQEWMRIEKLMAEDSPAEWLPITPGNETARTVDG